MALRRHPFKPLLTRFVQTLLVPIGRDKTPRSFEIMTSAGITSPFAPFVAEICPLPSCRRRINDKQRRIVSCFSSRIERVRFHYNTIYFHGNRLNLVDFVCRPGVNSMRRASKASRRFRQLGLDTRELLMYGIDSQV